MTNRMLMRDLIRQVGPTEAQEDWVSLAIEKHQENLEPERWSDRPNAVIHPSGSGSPCEREIELGMLGYRSGAKPKNRRRMDNGNSAHARWNQYLDDAGLLVVANVKERLDQPYLWSGECDVICRGPRGKLYVGELKTMNSRKFRELPAQVDPKQMGQVLAETLKSYVYQLTQYIVQFEDLHGTCRSGFILFENTDTQEYKVLYIEPDEDLRRKAFEVPHKASLEVQAGKLAEPPFRRNSLTCRRCWKSSICYRLQDDTTREGPEWQMIKRALEIVKSGPSGLQYDEPMSFYEDSELLDSSDPAG